MDQYEIWRAAVVKSNPKLPESYMRALYDHSRKPYNEVYSDIWVKEYDKLCQSRKREVKNCDTLVELIECAVLNLHDRLSCSRKRTHVHLE